MSHILATIAQNRVEGAHANLKISIQTSSGNLYSVFEQINKHYRLKVSRNNPLSHMDLYADIFTVFLFKTEFSIKETIG